ncbi:MAG: hypothetical protein Q8S73_12195 [Deltaproteobacteria bacterium]|jgi:hypothetical protein|nr:hypothetical protein [Myxococcales bacterium]MDP3214859.1 hypothetical protein [Deltaproteobacteria bacterium]
MRGVINWKSVLFAGLVSLALMPAAAQAGSGPSFCWDEARNPGGANRCTNSQQCDGARTCSAAGWCQGTARTPNPGPKGPNYCWDEARNPGGANRCTNSQQCDGARTCSAAGWCQGTAGHVSR